MIGNWWIFNNPHQKYVVEESFVDASQHTEIEKKLWFSADELRANSIVKLIIEPFEELNTVAGY